MADTPKQDENATPPDDDKGHGVHPDSMNPHVVPGKDDGEKSTDE